MVDDYPYNDESLLTPDSPGQVPTEYEPIAFALTFPALWRKLLEADERAKRAKRRTRMLGFAAVAMVTAALLAASAAPLYHDFHPWSDVAVAVAALLGVIGGALGLGLRSDKHKMEWLEQRLVSESLRQLNFRLLIILAPDILAAAASGDPKRFESKRAAALARFEADLVRRRKGVLERLIEKPGEAAQFPLGPLPDPEIFSSPCGELLLKAYREFRILRQCQYADHKLTTDGGLLSNFPRAQAGRLAAVGFACVLLLLLLHLLSAALVTWGAMDLLASLHYPAIWIALVALALRTVEDGLKPREEIDRYRHYQAVTWAILARFDASDVHGKLVAADALEQAAFNEMVVFLRSRREARFVM
jgi:hypothetical protein